VFSRIGNPSDRFQWLTALEVVTYHRRPIAVLLPVDQAWLEAEARRTAEPVVPGDDVWAELEAIRQEIGRSWQSEKTAVELISEQRR